MVNGYFGSPNSSLRKFNVVVLALGIFVCFLNIVFCTAANVKEGKIHADAIVSDLNDCGKCMDLAISPEFESENWAFWYCPMDIKKWDVSDSSQEEILVYATGKPNDDAQLVEDYSSIDSRAFSKLGFFPRPIKSMQRNVGWWILGSMLGLVFAICTLRSNVAGTLKGDFHLITFANIIVIFLSIFVIIRATIYNDKTFNDDILCPTLSVDYWVMGGFMASMFDILWMLLATLIFAISTNGFQARMTKCLNITAWIFEVLWIIVVLMLLIFTCIIAFTSDGRKMETSSRVLFATACFFVATWRLVALCLTQKRFCFKETDLLENQEEIPDYDSNHNSV